MNQKQCIGLIAGILALLIICFFPIPGLLIPARITLGVLVMAAIFWITEPIPIFATSMVIILLQVFLLSDNGLLSKKIFLEDSIHNLESYGTKKGFYWIPLDSLSIQDDKTVVYKQTETGGFQAIEIGAVDSLTSKKKNYIIGRSNELFPGDILAKDMEGWITSYNPTSYKKFYSTLANPIIILFLAGFALAAAVVKYNIDQSITKVLLLPFGDKPANIALGLMLVTALLSAFMSNTATTAMMMAIVLPIATQQEKDNPFRQLVALCIPVGANIGGIMTPIGTPPNAIVLAALSNDGVNISFSSWMLMTVPLALIMLFISWRILLLLFPPKPEPFKLKLTGEFKRTFYSTGTVIIFSVTIFLWLTEKLHGLSSKIIAFLPIALLPAIGAIDVKDIRNFSWEVLWLVAGGISLGISIQETQLAYWIMSLADLTTLGSVGLILIFAFSSYLFSNFVSNTVTATIIVPLAIGLGPSLIDRIDFSMPAIVITIALATSFAMILPISTPPNAIAMSTGLIKSQEMIKTGIIIGIIGSSLVIITGLVYLPLFF
ncbi:MAG: DASS family sodium-coupled anion symporter [Verrucomicrobiota bacterium]